MQHQLQLVTAGGPRFGGYDVPYETLRANIDMLQTLQDGLMYGSKVMNLKGMLMTKSQDHDQENLLFKDACSFWSPPDHVEIPDCDEFRNGLMSSGMHQAYQAYIRDARVLVSRLETVNVNGTSEAVTYASTAAINATMWWDEYQDISMLEEHYLDKFIGHSVKVYSLKATDLVDSAEMIQLTALFLLLGSVCFAYVFIVRRLVINLDNEVKRTRSLLLMIPDDVLQTLPSLRRFLIHEVVENSAGKSGFGFNK